MSAKSSGGGKLPGKTLYAGRRREMTRTSGFKVHSETTGGEFRRLQTPIAMLGAGKAFKVNFSISGHAKGDWIGYGVWFWHDDDAVATITEKSPVASTLTSYGGDSWNKAGSIWKAASDAPVELTLVITANKGARVAIYAPECGHIQHNYLDNARDALLKNMYQFSPEAIFITDKNTGRCKIEPPRELSAQTKPLILKSCNRCGRYLPINFPVERDQLSFNNHCVAAHRRPCRHATFGRLRNVENHQEVLQLDYGFQLECRFCKKFEVNAAHNPQRSSAQMKEDGARRRAFELLLAELYGGTPQLRYRHETGSE